MEAVDNYPEPCAEITGGEEYILPKCSTVMKQDVFGRKYQGGHQATSA